MSRILTGTSRKRPTARRSFSLSQPLLKNFWIDQTRFNIKVAKNRLKYTDLGLKQTIMTIVTTTEQAYYNLIYARENVTVQEKAVELAAQLVVENRKRVEFGALAILDQEQAEAQEASSRATLIAAKSTLVTQQNTVKQLITDDYAAMEPVELQPTASLGAPVRVFDRQISWSKGLTERPDLLQAKLDVERQGITLKYNYNQLFPEFMFPSQGRQQLGLEFQGRSGHNRASVERTSDGNAHLTQLADARKERQTERTFGPQSVHPQPARQVPGAGLEWVVLHRGPRRGFGLRLPG